MACCISSQQLLFSALCGHKIIPIFSNGTPNIVSSEFPNGHKQHRFCLRWIPLVAPVRPRTQMCSVSLSSPAGVSCGMADRCLTKGNAKVLVISLSLLVLISERKHRGGRVSLGRDIIGLEKGAFSLSKFEFDTSIIHQSASTSCPRLS